MKLLSIIVPVYNKSKYIDTCVESILAQTVTDFELILVNDGSVDNSGEKCDAFKKVDDRVIVFHQVNKGVSSARNEGLRIATGKYIGFVDADDILDIGMYELMIKNIIKYDADISMCGVRRVSPDKTQLYGGKNEIKLYNNDEGLTGLFSGEILLSNYDKIYKRETVKGILFQPALFEDTYYNFEALMASKLTVYDDTIMYNYMLRDNSHSLAAFNQKYMNALILAKRMVEVCAKDIPAHADEARAFDFNTNMINLNMLLINGKEGHERDYLTIVNNLKQYNNFYLKSKFVSARNKFGYPLFRLSPKLYTLALTLYSGYTKSEHLNRKQKLVTQV